MKHSLLTCVFVLLVAVPAPLTAQAPPAVTLDELSRLAVGQHPRLAQAGYAVEAAAGRAVQAGLPPNPVFLYNGDELGDRTGPSGIHSPAVSQEFVRGNKLALARAAALKEVDQATLTLYARRLELLAAVRAAYFDVLAAERRAKLLTDVVTLAEAGLGTMTKLLAAKEVAPIELVLFEAELERLRADREAAAGELAPARRRLAAVVGVPSHRLGPLADALDLPLPAYDLAAAQAAVAAHPERLGAQAGAERAHRLLQRAKAEPTPNVTLLAGYTRQGQNRSNDWAVGLVMPIPVWNRNQGGIREAAAEYGSACQEVLRVEADLADRVAAAFREYAAARARAERYRNGVLPKAKEAYDLAANGYQGGQIEFLRVTEAQRAYTQATLDHAAAVGAAWAAAATLSGLTMEEQWPPVPAAPAPPAPAPGPVPGK